MYNFFMRKFDTFKIITSCLMVAAFSSFGIVKTQDNYSKPQTEIKCIEEPIDYGDEIDNEYLYTTLDSVYATETSLSIAVSFYANEDYNNSFYVGYGTSEADYKPATFEYKIRTYSGSSVTRRIALQRNNKNAYYDMVGAISENSITLNADIEIAPGEQIVGNNFRVYNIFKCAKNPETGRYGLDDETNPTHYYSITTKDTLFKQYSFSDFASVKYEGCSTFNGYSTINFSTTSFGPDLVDVYTTISSTIRRTYNDRLEEIENGITRIRTMLTFNVDSRFIAYYENGDVVEYETNTDRLDITKSGTSIVLLYKDFKTEGLTDFEFYNFYVYVDLYSTNTYKSIPKSNAVLRFANKKVGVSQVVNEGGEVVIEQNKNPFFVNVDLVITISALSFLALYAAGTIALFTYRKKKYAQDEFKRVRPKEFFTTATMGLFCLECLIIAIESIIFRATVLNTSFDVYNTIDILIVVFSIASIILVGYFIKYFATEIKNIKQKRENDRLKLNEDKMDDGVLLMPNAKK